MNPVGNGQDFFSVGGLFALRRHGVVMAARQHHEPQNVALHGVSRSDAWRTAVASSQCDFPDVESVVAFVLFRAMARIASVLQQGFDVLGVEPGALNIAGVEDGRGCFRERIEELS